MWSGRSVHSVRTTYCIEKFLDLMNQAFHEYLDSRSVVFIDDMLVYLTNLVMHDGTTSAVKCVKSTLFTSVSLRMDLKMR